VSETLERPDAVPIGAEYWGKARAFRMRVVAEDAAFGRELDAWVKPIIERLKRHPNRPLRPGTLAALIEAWRFTEHRNFRIDLDAKLERKRASIVERRVVSGQMHREGWQGYEDDVGVNALGVLINGPDVQFRSKTLCNFSLHSIARRLQRGRDASDEALMFDMDLVAKIDQEKLDAPGGFKVRTDAEGGGWRGRTVMQSSSGAPPVRVLSIRTWLN
jgi:hypothetical protein